MDFWVQRLPEGVQVTQLYMSLYTQLYLTQLQNTIVHLNRTHHYEIITHHYAIITHHYVIITHHYVINTHHYVITQNTALTPVRDRRFAPYVILSF